MSRMSAFVFITRRWRLVVQISLGKRSERIMEDEAVNCSGASLATAVATLAGHVNMRDVAVHDMRENARCGYCVP